MKNLKLKTLAVIMAAVMLLLPTAVFAEEGVTYEIGAALQADTVETVCTAEYEASTLDYTVYTFDPTEIGTYTISSENLLGIVSYNGMWVTVEPTTNTVAQNSVTWECKSVGQSIWVAVQTNGAPATITVEYTPIEIKVIEIVTYENSTTPEAFVFDGDINELVNVNTLNTKVDVPVMGPDGLYRLNEATGPRIFVDLNDAQMSLVAAIDYGQLKVAIYNEAGEIDHYVDYNTAFSQYIECMDSATGLYPLTDDLMEIYREVGNYKGWYGTDGWLGGTQDDAWMFACYYYMDETYEEVWPETDPATLTELAETTLTANGRIVVDFTDATVQKDVFAFTTWRAGTYTVTAEGSSSKEVWVVDANGEIVASLDAATTATAKLDIEAANGATYYVVSRCTGTTEDKVATKISVNYFSGVAGDANGDGRVNSRDTVIIKRYITNNITEDSYSVKGIDFDGNGRVNSQDLVKLKKVIAS